MAGTSLKFSLTGESTGLEGAMGRIGKMSAATAAKMSADFKRELAKVDAAISNVAQGSTAATALNTKRYSLMRQIETADRNASRGDISGFSHGGIAAPMAGKKRHNFAVAGSMFTSVARDSAASLASGAPITQVIAQQAPQVLQALAMMKLTTVAWVSILAGGALVAWHGITKSIGDAVYQSTRLVGVNKYLEDRAAHLRSIRKGLEQTQILESKSEVKALEAKNKILDLDERLNALQLEKNKLLAEEAHITGKQMGGSRTEQQLEYEKLKLDLAELEKKLTAAQNSDPGEVNRKKQAIELAEAEQKLTDAKTEQGKIAQDWHPSNAGANQQRSWQISNFVIPELEQDIQDLKDAAASGGLGDGKSKEATIKDIENQILSVKNQMRRQSLYELAAKEMTRSGQALGMTENQRLGAFGGGPTFTLIDINKQQLRELTEIKRAVTGKGGTRGVNFGK